jgi:hypothetical protein
VLGLGAALGATFYFTDCCGDDDPEVVLGTGTPTPAATREPSATPSPAANAIPWADAVDLIEGCEVTGVTQTHALDIYLVLDDGTEVRTKAPEIDLVLGIAGEAIEKCGTITIATE